MKRATNFDIGLDVALFVAGGLKCALGLVAAFVVRDWLQGWMLLAFLAGAVWLGKGMYWRSILVLIGAAYADLPVREWLGVELSERVAFQALVAVPLWLLVMSFPQPLQGRARAAAWVCCATAFVPGFFARFLLPTAYWTVVAPLALAAVVVLLVRLRLHHVRFGTGAWICGLAILPAAVVVCFELFFPSTLPTLARVAPWVNLWLSLGPVAMIVLNLGGKSHGTDGKADPRMGPSDRRVPRWKRDGVQRQRAGMVGDLLPALRAEARSASAVLRVSEGRHGAEAGGDRRVVAGRWGSWSGADGRGAGQHDEGDGRHDSLRPEVDDFGTDPLQTAKVAQ